MAKLTQPGPWDGPVGHYDEDGEATDDSYAGCNGEFSGDGIQCAGDVWTRPTPHQNRDFYCDAHRSLIDQEANQ